VGERKRVTTDRVEEKKKVKVYGIRRNEKSNNKFE
jgi:hypothetical protein